MRCPRRTPPSLPSFRLPVAAFRFFAAAFLLPVTPFFAGCALPRSVPGRLPGLLCFFARFPAAFPDCFELAALLLFPPSLLFREVPWGDVVRLRFREGPEAEVRVLAAGPPAAFSFSGSAFAVGSSLFVFGVVGAGRFFLRGTLNSDAVESLVEAAADDEEAAAAWSPPLAPSAPTFLLPFTLAMVVEKCAFWLFAGSQLELFPGVSVCWPAGSQAGSKVAGCCCPAAALLELLLLLLLRHVDLLRTGS